MLLRATNSIIKKALLPSARSSIIVSQRYFAQNSNNNDGDSKKAGNVDNKAPPTNDKHEHHHVSWVDRMLGKKGEEDVKASESDQKRVVPPTPPPQQAAPPKQAAPPQPERRAAEQPSQAKEAPKNVAPKEEKKQAPPQQSASSAGGSGGNKPPSGNQKPSSSSSGGKGEGYSVGKNVRRVDSTPDHQPPQREDTIGGRYAGVLFSSASRAGALYQVYEDMSYLSELYKSDEHFKLFTENAGLSRADIVSFNGSLKEVGDFSEVTLNFIEVLGDNKRFMYINDAAEKYLKLYQQFSKEEKITIISAQELNAEEKGQVLEALKKNPENEGKEFQLEFKVDETILGGLQMYTESKFMDMSLASRIDKISAEIEKLVV